MADQDRKLTTGDGRVVGIQDILDLYRSVVSESKPSSGKIKPVPGSQSYLLTSNYETFDCDQLEILECSKNHLLTVEDENGTSHLKVQRVLETNGPVDVVSAQSKSGKYLARVKNSAKGADKKQILEIWNRSRIIKSIEVSELEAHGLINTDPVFISFCWSKFDENKLLYVCERKKPKDKSYFKQKLDSPEDLKSLGLNYSRSENWGECLGDIEHTIVAVLDVGNDCKITTLDMAGYSLGDSQWLNSSQTVSVAYPEDPRRLGIIYCNSRPSVLVVHDWSCSPPKEVRRIQDEKLSFTSPRVSEQGETFVYMAAPTYGAHYHAQFLYLCDKQHTQLLVESDTQATCHFIDELPRECFLRKDRFVLFVRSNYIVPPCDKSAQNPVQALCQQLCLFDLKELRVLDTDFPASAVHILDVRDDVIFASGSEINVHPSLYVAKLPAGAPLTNLEWHAIEVVEKCDDVSFAPFKISTSDGSSFVSGVLVSPDLKELSKRSAGESMSSVGQEKDLPTVVLPHGGPHGAFGLDYIPVLIVYARLGLRTLLINYRGSSGVSEEYLNSLLGHVGELDVEDCLQAIRHFVQSGLLDPNKLIIQGGSHGGFLAAHLSCQQEFKFTSAIIKNPVIDISSMHTTTDIPDWCYTEALGSESYSPSYLPNAQELAKMFECSPLSKFRDAAVPTLMLLGNQDKRVPMFQGERWYQLLKARGVKTQCKVYDDKHDLAKPESASDGTITAIIWILSQL